MEELVSASGTSMVDQRYLTLASELLAGAKTNGVAASVAPGGLVLDVGCGTGADAVELARLGGPDARVVGVDTDAAMVAVANGRAAAAGLTDRVECRVAPAERLPFGDEHVDVVHAERVLQHCVDPAAAVAEMVRVTRTGGRIVLVDTDWASVSLACLDRDVERSIAALLLGAVPSPTVGRELPHLLRAAGCTVVEVTPHVIAFRDIALTRIITRLPEFEAAAVECGAITEAAHRRWLDSCTTLAAEEGFLGYAVITVAVGAVTP